MKKKSNFMQTFIHENWLLIILSWIIILFMGYEIHKLYKNSGTLILPPTVDNRIDSLQNVVDNLCIDYIKLKNDYDSVQSKTKSDIKYIYLKNAKDISNIRNYNTAQRDSMWATLNP